MDIRALAYVIIESTDIDQWRHFATQVVGMMEADFGGDPQNLYLKMDEYPYRFLIQKGEQDRFVRSGWQLPDKPGFEQALAELDQAGMNFTLGAQEAATKRHVAAFAALTAPGGIELELCYDANLDYEPLVSPVGVKRFVTGEFGSMGLGHIAVATPDLEASHAFFTQVLGFGQTDYMHFHFNPEPGDPGQGLHFLHCNNPRHHSVALFQSAEPMPGNLVHMMVEVEDVDELGYFMDRVKHHGVKVDTPLGRHTNDRMISTYVQTPAGFALEVGYGGLQLDWTTFTPTRSAKPSLWGHHWGENE